MTTGQVLKAMKRMKETMMSMTVMPLTLGEMTLVMSILHYGRFYARDVKVVLRRL